MPVPALAIASGIPLAAAGLRYLYDNPRRVLQKATEALEVASGIALARHIPWFGAVQTTKAATRFLGLQPQYHSNQRTYQRSLETVYSRSFRNARNPIQRSSWRRQKIWNKRKIRSPWTKKKRHWRAKRTWKTSRHATRPTRNV